MVLNVTINTNVIAHLWEYILAVIKVKEILMQIPF